jgi:hypothetical protein
MRQLVPIQRSVNANRKVCGGHGESRFVIGKQRRSVRTAQCIVLAA